MKDKFQEMARDMKRLLTETEGISQRVASTASREEFEALKADSADLSRRLDELHHQLDNTPDTPPRAVATGGVAGTLTDY